MRMIGAALAGAAVALAGSPAAADLLVYDGISGAVSPSLVFFSPDDRYADDTFLPAGSPLTLTAARFSARNPTFHGFSGTFTATIYASTPGPDYRPGAALGSASVVLAVPAQTSLTLDVMLPGITVPSREIWTGWEAVPSQPSAATVIVRTTGGGGPVLGTSEDRFARMLRGSSAPWTVQTNGAGVWGGPEYTYSYRIALTAVPGPGGLAALGVVVAAAGVRRGRSRGSAAP